MIQNYILNTKYVSLYFVSYLQHISIPRKPFSHQKKLRYENLGYNIDIINFKAKQTGPEIERDRLSYVLYLVTVLVFAIETMNLLSLKFKKTRKRFF